MNRHDAPSDGERCPVGWSLASRCHAGRALRALTRSASSWVHAVAYPPKRMSRRKAICVDIDCESDLPVLSAGLVAGVVLFPGGILRLPLKHHGIYQGTAALPNSLRLGIPACKLEGDGAALLAEQVAKWPWLRRLSLAENGLTNQDAAGILGSTCEQRQHRLHADLAYNAVNNSNQLGPRSDITLNIGPAWSRAEAEHALSG